VGYEELGEVLYGLVPRRPPPKERGRERRRRSGLPESGGVFKGESCLPEPSSCLWPRRRTDPRAELVTMDIERIDRDMMYDGFLLIISPPTRSHALSTCNGGCHSPQRPYKPPPFLSFPSSPKMSTRPPPAPTHVHRACSTCTAPFQHEPVWISDPKESDPEHPRNRTFILCFDGTGDFFDKDVSQSPGPSYPRPRLELNTGICRSPTSRSSLRC
jgi:hypothetical protein